MLNIVSTQACSGGAVRGPGKVFHNLVKGLRLIDYPFVVNKRMDATERLWIHDDTTALRRVKPGGAHVVVGPNLYVMPAEMPKGLRLEGVVYLQPCTWAKGLWEHAGFRACPIECWPVGVDTDEFKPSHPRDRDLDVLVYHKHRDTAELEEILGTLRRSQLTHAVVVYGHYCEEDYKRALSRASFIVWHGSHETQGLAFQEAMASDVPVLVCDVTRLSEAGEEYSFPEEFRDWPATAAPYFDETCGVRIRDLSELPEAIREIRENLRMYAPRDYVERNLSLADQATAFIRLWERWGLTVEGGRHEPLLSDRAYRAPLSCRIRSSVGALRRRARGECS
jgi:hypothetical protein